MNNLAIAEAYAAHLRRGGWSISMAMVETTVRTIHDDGTIETRSLGIEILELGETGGSRTHDVA